ncbi:DUF916 and DUF3324 domain-containing protein [Candidatus Enterococcus mansonii]|uniref:Uncharacterized protein n=1 Tax=Candidatus Enterococcus mansonii TaxID=1834181 RepID=A0A242CEU4_9ENTE|nr:DUF916 and DUF3324 domain-containing protein [Enterococcus sp. 4G2_DIV0659]OTO08440.1 hypothetical protein A5880_001440 [Enterococcus sp. 4G2_DIV0659]
MYILKMTHSSKQLILKIAILVSCIISALCMLATQSQATEDDTGGFSVKAILPENQLNKDVTYYDLRVKPNLEQTLDLELYNSTKEVQNVSVTINPGITNDNGLIDYSEREKEYQYDDSLTLSITDIASTDKEVSIPALSKVTTKIHLKTPSQPFKGMVLGGIYVTSLSKDKEKQESSEGGMQIKNKVVYSVGIKLTESDEPVEGDLLYEKGQTKAGQEAGRNIIKSKIRNLAPINVDELSYHAKIYAENAQEIVAERAVSGYRMAPNSYFHYQVPWGSQPFKAGKYRMELSAESKVTGQKWQWKDNFEITQEEAKTLNESAIDLEETTNWLLYVALGIGLILLIGLVIVFIWLHKRKKEKQRKLKAQRNRKKRKKKQNQRSTERKRVESSSKKVRR